MDKFHALILAKSESRRLPGKNLKDFHGEPLFLVNVRKCLDIFDKVYVSSDSKNILDLAEQIGAIGILRSEKMCGEVPNIIVYKHALGLMDDNTDGIVAVQACSPNIDSKLILTVKGLMEIGYKEVMTCYPLQHCPQYHDQSSKINGSIWGVSVDKLLKYEDPYKPTPDILLVDDSTDIHYEEDFNIALKQAKI